MRTSIFLLAVSAFRLVASDTDTSCPAVRTITTVYTETATVYEEATYSSTPGHATEPQNSSPTTSVTLPDTATSEAASTSTSQTTTPSAVPVVNPSTSSAWTATTFVVSVISSSTATPSAAGSSTKKSSTAAASSSSTAAAGSASTSASASTGTSTGSATSSASGASVTGESTFYGGNLSGGTCSFTTYTLPSGMYGTAFSGTSWDASECGACLEVTGPNGNSITVMVVDECPECETGHLDLFQDAFAELGDISAGTIATSYTPVACGITSPLVLHSKTGTSAYWFSLQVVNANEPVASLEVSTDGGSTWQETTRSTYNFFENSSGFGTDTVDVRVTSQSGGTVEVSGVSVASDAQTTASANF